MLRWMPVLANFTARRFAISWSGSESVYLLDKEELSSVYTCVRPARITWRTRMHLTLIAQHARVHVVWDPTKRRLPLTGRGLFTDKQLLSQWFRKLKYAYSYKKMRDKERGQLNWSKFFQLEILLSVQNKVYDVWRICKSQDPESQK